MMQPRYSHPLTLDEIGRRAPSALAVSAHESRSSRYTYVPTVEIIKGMQNAGFLPFDVRQSSTRDASRREFTKHMIRFRRESDIQRAAIVGDVVPEIVMVNAHDGTAAYNLIAGLWRFVCGNGMMVSDSQIGSVHVQHKGDIVGQVIEGSWKLAESSDATIQTVQTWNKLQLTSGEQNAFAESAHILRFGDAEGQTHTPITANQLLHLRRHDDGGNDLWSTLNRVQENVIRGGLSARTAPSYDENGRRVPSRRVTTRQVNGIDQDVKLNRALWSLAERMAELKAA